MRAPIEITAFDVSGEGRGESVDRNKAIGYLIARAMAAEVLGNKERCKAFTEAAQLLRSMPSIDGPGTPPEERTPCSARPPGTERSRL